MANSRKELLVMALKRWPVSLSERRLVHSITEIKQFALLLGQKDFRPGRRVERTEAAALTVSFHMGGAGWRL